MSSRFQDWPLRLDRFIAARRSLPFSWGEQDCCQVARRAIEAVTGEDPAVAWELRAYRTSRGALSQLPRLGGLESLPARAGLPECAVLLAGRGDLALCPNTGRPALGVVLGAEVAFAGKQGLEFLPLAECIKAWRVG